MLCLAHHDLASISVIKYSLRLLYHTSKAFANNMHLLKLMLYPVQTHTAPMPECLLNWSVHSYNTSAYMQQLCKPGYWGPMCSLCVKDPIMVDGHNVTFGRNGPLKCRICRSSAVIVLTYIASSIVVLLWLSYTVHVTLHDNEEAARGNSDPGRTAQLIRVSLDIQSPRSFHVYVTPTC